MGRLNHRNPHLSGLQWGFLLQVVRNDYCFLKGVSGALDGHSSGDPGLWFLAYLACLAYLAFLPYLPNPSKTGGVFARKQKKTVGATNGFKIAMKKILLLLVSHHSELFLSLMCSNLMLLSFSSTRHCRTPYFPEKREDL